MTYTFKLARRLAVSRHIAVLPVLILLACNDTDPTAPEVSPLALVAGQRAKVKSIDITPSSATLAAGARQTFTAVGRLANDSPVPIDVQWEAEGGTVDEDGVYVAGDSGGTFRVIATSLAGAIADTAAVTISPPPAPALASVTLAPASVSLAPGASTQFAAYGRTTTGDSVEVTALYTGTGGTVSTTGLYTAGAQAGTFQLVATSGELADTSTITITAPPLPLARGIPYGAFNLFKSWLVINPPGPFTISVGSVGPNAIVAQIDTARKYRVKLILQMTGGSHSSYITNGKFDLTKWKAVQALYNTSAIRDAVAKGVADGTILLAELQDEPEHSDWGGVMSIAMLDEMSRYTKSIFPTLKTSILTQWTWIKSRGVPFQSVDVAGTQYDWRRGPVTAYRDSAVAVMRRANVGLLFSMNILNGGEQLGPSCPLDRTGGPGTWFYGFGDTWTRNCAMTAAQVEQWGKLFGLTPEACALIMWRHYPYFMDNPANQAAFANVASAMATREHRACGRES